MGLHLTYSQLVNRLDSVKRKEDALRRFYTPIKPSARYLTVIPTVNAWRERRAGGRSGGRAAGLAGWRAGVRAGWRMADGERGMGDGGERKEESRGDGETGLEQADAR
jgi:hypothetical protein